MPCGPGSRNLELININAKSSFSPGHFNSCSLSVHLEFELEDKVAHHSKEDKEPEQDQNVDPIRLKMRL